jgi:hypothetical protein
LDMVFPRLIQDLHNVQPPSSAQVPLGDVQARLCVLHAIGSRSGFEQTRTTRYAGVRTGGGS